MLPERISNDLCSLREGEDRACLVVRMVFDQDGNKRSHTFLRAMMRSAAKLSYQEAQAAIDGQPVRQGRPAARARAEAAVGRLCGAGRGARPARSRSTSTCPSARSCSTSKAASQRRDVPERLAAHRLIEEFMIQANVAAAETLEQRKTPVVYRVHDQPSKEKLSSLRDFLDTLEHEAAAGGHAEAGPLQQASSPRAKTLPVADLVNEVVLRSQSQAEYASTTSATSA